MKLPVVNIGLAVILIILGLIGYWMGESTFAVAIAFGILFALVTPPYRKGNPIVRNVVLILTFLLSLAFVIILIRNLASPDWSVLILNILILIVCITAFVFFVRNKEVS